MDTNQTKISDLQILRGVSIVFVLMFHFSFTASLFGKISHILELESYGIAIRVPFWIGVEIFFVLSGYVVTRSLIKDGFHPGRFFVRRAFRLYPAIAFFLGFSLLVSTLFSFANIDDEKRLIYVVPFDRFVREAGSILLGFENRIGAVTYYNGAMWSLSVEFQFYAFVTLLLVFMSLMSYLSAFIDSELKLGLFASAAGVLVTVVMIHRQLILFAPDVARQVPRIVEYLTIWKFEFLGAGVLLAAFESRLPRWGRTVPLPFVISLLVIPAVMITFCESMYVEIYEAPVLQGIALVVSLFCFSILTSFASQGAAFGNRSGIVFRVLYYLGDRSYSIYLLHFSVFAVAWFLMEHTFFGRVPPPRQFILVSLMLFPLVEFCYRWIELPCIDLGKGIERRLFPKYHGEFSFFVRLKELTSVLSFPQKKRTPPNSL